MPASNSIESSLLHDIIGDIVDLYEVNRKEGAKLFLTSFRDVFLPELFFPPLAEDNKKKTDASMDITEDHRWRLEACIVEVCSSKH